MITRPLIAHTGATMLSSEASIVFGPVDFCIYCGRRDGLTREHVMPRGMLGEMVLLRSSCPSCSEITSKIDNFVLSKMLIKLRMRHNLSSRKGKRNTRPKSFDLSCDLGDGKFSSRLAVSPEELPQHAYALPLYGFPGYLLQIPPEEAKKSTHIRSVISKSDVEAMLVLSKNKPVNFQFGEVDLDTFNRFLFKIAHSYACCILGYAKFIPSLKERILTENAENRYLIGCDDPEPAAPFLFEMNLTNCKLWHGEECYIVRIRLFSFLETPTYIVVVGHPKRNVPNTFRNHYYAVDWPMQHIST